MAWVAEVANTFTEPNYAGMLYQVTPSDTPFLTAIGGLTTGGGRVVTTKEFEDSTFDLPAPENPNRLEGANAPTVYSARRSQLKNVVQIFHESYGVTYTKSAAIGQLDGLGIAAAMPSHGLSEMAFQRMVHLKKMARDIEYTFLNSTYSVPADNNTARKTRGIIDAIVSNVTDANGAGLAPLMVDETMQSVWTNGGIAEQGTAVIMCGGYQKRKLSDIYGYAPSDRNVGGVNIKAIETDFGVLGVMLNRYLAAGTMLIISMEVLHPTYLLVIDPLTGAPKGVLFEEALAKTGSADNYQIYGEIGLDTGPEWFHGMIEDLATS